MYVVIRFSSYQNACVFRLKLQCDFSLFFQENFDVLRGWNDEDIWAFNCVIKFGELKHILQVYLYKTISSNGTLLWSVLINVTDVRYNVFSLVVSDKFVLKVNVSERKFLLIFYPKPLHKGSQKMSSYKDVK